MNHDTFDVHDCREGITPGTRETLLAANEDAAQYYRQQLLLPVNSGPRNYLCERGFAALLDDTRWTVGYAPGGWTTLLDHLASQGYSDTTLLDAGLASRTRHGRLIDRFRDRLTFGIRHTDGSLVGFTARRSPTASSNVPKYLNTPRTVLYDKSSTLFGIGEQAHRLRTGATPVLVEGPLDAIAVDLTNTPGTPSPFAPVALCGTALTNAQALALADLTKDAGTRTAILALDPDDAGTRASERAGHHLAGLLPDLRAPSLSEGRDVAAAFRLYGSDDLRIHLETAESLTDHLIDQHLRSWPNLHESAETELACLRELAAALSSVPTRDMAQAARRLAHETGVGLDTITCELLHATAPEPVHTQDASLSAIPAQHSFPSHARAQVRR